MNDPPCGQPHCPVASPTPQLLRRVRTVVEPAGTRLVRGVRNRHPPDELVPGVGDTRFAPLDDTSHTYLSASRTAALLESALHEATPPTPTLLIAELSRWDVVDVRLTERLRLADLRDLELARLGVGRDQLVTTSAAHYPCTRRWGNTLQGRTIGGEMLAGAVWHSRQADLHAAAQTGGLAADLLVHRTVEVMVLWSPPASRRPIEVDGVPEPLVVDGEPARLVQELAALIGAPIM